MSTPAIVPAAVVSALDAQAKAFGLKLDKRGHANIFEHLISCTVKLVAILNILAGHCSKSSIDGKDVQYLKLLSKVFLAVQPMSPPPKNVLPPGAAEKSKKRTGFFGGAETTLPSEYFGGTNFAYSAAAGTSTGVSTADYVRPALLMNPPLMNQCGGDGASEFDAAFSSMSSFAAGEDGHMMHGGAGHKISHLTTDAFLHVLAHPSMPQHPHLRDDARDGLKFIVECNLLHLFTRIKSERRKTVVKRGAPVTSAVIRSAMHSSTCIIPI